LRKRRRKNDIKEGEREWNGNQEMHAIHQEKHGKKVE